jgi:hypothetical protein
VSDGRKSQRPQTGGVRADGRRRKPADGKCEACEQRLPLVWHHCHDCGVFIAWLCDPCNLTLTEHAIEYWDRISQVHLHECAPRLAIELPPLCSSHSELPRHGTRNLYMANGGGDGRYVSISTLSGYITVEQLAAVAGINANTARDYANGRRNERPIGEKIGGTWFIPFAAVIAFLEQRWEMTAQ